MQKKLRADNIEACKKAREHLHCITDWNCTAEGVSYWVNVVASLKDMAKHGTSDGKPWVEPPLTDEDAKQRPWVMVRDSVSEPWCGPTILAYVNKNAGGSPEYLDTVGVWWGYARKATAEEIPARAQESTQ